MKHFVECFVQLFSIHVAGECDEERGRVCERESEK